MKKNVIYIILGIFVIILIGAGYGTEPVIQEELELESQPEEIVQEITLKENSQTEQELKQVRLETEKTQAEAKKAQTEVEKAQLKTERLKAEQEVEKAREEAEKIKAEQEAQELVKRQKEESLVEGYSKLNPAAILTPITVEDEANSHIYKWKITVLEFLRGSQALAQMEERCKTDPYCYLENVASGYEYLLVRLEAECVQGFISDETVISKPQCAGGGVVFVMGFTIVSSDEKEFSGVDQIRYGTNLGRWSEEGISSTDWFAFRVPSDDTKLLLRYRGFDSDSIWFQIY